MNITTLVYGVLALGCVLGESCALFAGVIQGIDAEGDSVALTLATRPDTEYDVQSSDDLVVWRDLQSAAGQSTAQRIELCSPASRQFFRVRPRYGFDAPIIYCYPGAANLSTLQALGRERFPGVVKMSGIWVSKLPVGDYLADLKTFLGFAVAKGQKAIVQIPVAFTDQEVADVLAVIADTGAIMAGFSIGSEVDRLVVEGIRPAYDVATYINDTLRMAPAIRAAFPQAEIIAMELSSFEGTMDSWVTPFCASGARDLVDRLGVHFYPFTGAQKLWENLYLVELFDAFVAQVPSNAPPLFVGEFNATYQYEAQMTYPGSGGDSLMVALRLPELFRHPEVTALAHWSLVESAPSTLGLFDAATQEPSPLYHAYRMLDGLVDRVPITVASSCPEMTATAFASGDRVLLYLANRTPFFLRRVAILNEGISTGRYVRLSGVTTTPGVLTVAPFSLTRITFDPSGDMRDARWFGLSQPVTTTNLPAAGLATSVCLADFGEPNNTAPHFVTPDYDQNKKIASGGTFTTDNSPGSSCEPLQDNAGHLRFAYSIPASGQEYYHAKVQFPLYSEEFESKFPELVSKVFDYGDGLANGELAITMSGPSGAKVQIEWCSLAPSVAPEALGWNTHRATMTLGNGVQTYTVALGSFSQQAGWGIQRPFLDVLRMSSYLTIGIAAPGQTGVLRIERMDLLDHLSHAADLANMPRTRIPED